MMLYNYQSRQEKTSDAQIHQITNYKAIKNYPSRTIVHAKLEMTEPGDHDEQEADAVANTIAAGGKISRKITGGSGTSGITVSNQMENQLNHLQGGGHAMPTGLRNMMESGFGQDFSHVRLHTDSEAATLSSSIHAKAFTHGNDIYFNQGQFSPDTSEGQKLMAHELTHVVQGGRKIGRYNPDSAGWDRHAEAAREFVASVKSPLDSGTALNIINLINDIFGTINNAKTLKDMEQLRKLLSTIRTVADKELGIMRSAGDIVKATAKNANATTSKAMRRIGWAGVLLALQDLYSSIKSVDFENNPVASTSVIVIKTANLSSVIISQPSILAKVAAVSPTTAGLVFAFGAGYATGDAINILSEMLFGKAPGAALVDYVMEKDLTKVTKDDVINYPNYAEQRVSVELRNAYESSLDDSQRKYITIMDSSKTGGNRLFKRFMLAYRNEIRSKTDEKFLRDCFLYASTSAFRFSIRSGGEKIYCTINNFDIYILRQAFEAVGLY